MYRDVDPGVTDEERALREAAHEFARDRIRPAAREIDRMGPDEYAAVGERPSPYWDVLAGIKGELGAHRKVLPPEVGGEGISGRGFAILMEELAWGSPGLAIAFGVDTVVPLLAVMSFDEDLREQFLEPYLADDDAEFQGCWGVTEPAHGSEHVMAETLLRDGAGADADIPDPEVTAEPVEDGVVISGRKAEWVSAGPVATHCALHVDMDPKGGDPGALCLVPLDGDGVTRGAPIEKLGQRDCPQGELVFDEVHVPEANVVLTSEMLHPDTGLASFDQILCFTSAGMAAVATGLARAAFEEALSYARERKQGGGPIAEHQSVKRQLYEMYERVETSRAYARRACEHVFDRNLANYAFDASPRHCLAAQVYCKRSAFEVAHTALQLHGANGITREYPVEKLFRDARVKLIEDGTTEVLGLEAAANLVENYVVD